MRDLERNKRTIYYATKIGEERILDEYGNDTLEVRSIYAEPTPLRVNVSANLGHLNRGSFGWHTDYSRTLTMTGESCPLNEGTKIWFHVPLDGPFNYTVVKVADSKNGFLIALQGVVASE